MVAARYYPLQVTLPSRQKRNNLGRFLLWKAWDERTVRPGRCEREAAQRSARALSEGVASDA
jgi:hypothetical protein